MFAIKHFENIIAFRENESAAKADVERLRQPICYGNDGMRIEKCTDEYTYVPISLEEALNYLMSGLNLAHNRLDARRL